MSQLITVGDSHDASWNPKKCSHPSCTLTKLTTDIQSLPYTLGLYKSISVLVCLGVLFFLAIL